MNKKHRGTKRISNYWFLSISILIFFHYKIEDFFLKFFGVCTRVVVPNELRYHSGHPRTYKFTFYVNGERFSGDSWMTESSSKGHTISVVYLKYNTPIKKLRAAQNSKLTAQNSKLYINDGVSPDHAHGREKFLHW